jgi:hypothetical protein
LPSFKLPCQTADALRSIVISSFLCLVISTSCCIDLLGKVIFFDAPAGPKEVEN